MARISDRKDGFTIVELMIATMVFSMILLVVTAAVISIGRLYYKGYTYSQTQETARSIMDDISNNIKFSGKGQLVTPKKDTNNNVWYFCIGSRRYSYVEDLKLTDKSLPIAGKETSHALVVDTLSDCNKGAQDLLSGSPVGAEMLGQNMSIAKIEIKNNDSTDTNSQAYRVHIKVVYGDRDFVSGSGFDENCGNQAGNQFCGTSELSTIVLKRVN